MHEERGKYRLYTGKMQSVETIPEEAQALDLLGKDFKSIILNMLKEFKQHNQPTILTDIYRTLYIKIIAFTFFPNSYGAFSMIDHMLGYKFSLHRRKNINIIQSNLFDHNRGKLEIIKNWKIYKISEIKNTILYNQQIKE